ncbi:MAG: efflux RND transporter periplasmic adaptor subunit [Rhodospirillaceae bacterium]|jgi:membrane fusion protein, multidrug efflux system|nr:efflux RND transporter periplasmic adaptor subunit [Rhodospirillaceae bacterium]
MNKSYLIAGAIASVAALWIASGAVFAPSRKTELSASEQAALNQPEGLQRVQVMRSTAMPRIREIKVAGRTVASRQITIRSETESAVTNLVVPRGTTVKKGDALISLAIEDREALVRKAKALVAKRQLEFRASENLSKKSFASEVSLANSKAELESAQADLTGAELELNRATIRAPFDGVFNMNHVEVGDYLRVGDDVAVMIDLDPVLVIAEVAELAVGEIQEGSSASAKLIDGTVVYGPVTYISSVATPETRTFLVEVSISNEDGALIDGLTATLHLPAQETLAHRLPPAALTLDDSGAVGVKIVDPNNRVVFAEADVSSSSVESIWLTGLPDAVSIITVGQEFVKVGQQVEPVVVGPDTGNSAEPLSHLPSHDKSSTRLARIAEKRQ